MEGRVRKSFALASRAAQLSVRRQIGRTHGVLAQPLPGTGLRRSRARAQPGDRRARRKHVALVARIGNAYADPRAVPALTVARARCAPTCETKSRRHWAHAFSRTISLAWNGIAKPVKDQAMRRW